MRKLFKSAVRVLSAIVLWVGMSAALHANVMTGFVWDSVHGPTLLGVLPGYTHSEAFAVNNAGLVVGTCSNETNTTGFAWSREMGMVQLNPLPGYDSCSATAVNNLGQIVGTSTSDYPYHVSEACLWNPDGTLVGLGSLGNFLPESSFAYGINDAGQVVGESVWSEDTFTTYRSFVWTAGSGMVPLGGVGHQARAVAINNHGQVLGSYWPWDGEPKVALWDASAPDELPVLEFGDAYPEGLDINDLGQIVTGNGVLWAPDTHDAVILPLFPHAINGTGVVAGYTSRDLPGGSNAGDACIWDATTGLTALIPTAIYSYAYDINDLGLVVGSCYVPEPSSVLVLLCGFVALPMLTRRRT